MKPLFLCLLACGLAAHAAPSPDSVALARVGDTEVTAEDIRASLDTLDANSRAAIARDPALLSQVVRTLLVQRLVLKEALAKHWDLEPAVAALIQRAHDSTIVESYLQAASLPPDSYPSDTELHSAYDSNKAALLVPRQWRLAQIFVALPKGSDAAATAKAQTKLDSIRKSLRAHDADFAEVARARSDEPKTAERGGELGWLTASRVQPEIRSKVTTLAKGALSEPVRLDDGWHILKCLDIKEPYTPALEDIRPELAQQLRTERAKANRQAYLAKLLQVNPVAVNELALSKLLNK